MGLAMKMTEFSSDYGGKVGVLPPIAFRFDRFVLVGVSISPIKQLAL